MEAYEAERQEQLELLSRALQQQRRSVRGFELLIAAAPDRADKRLLSSIQREERRHYYLLEGIYEEIAGHAFRPPRVSLALPRQYIPMLQVAIRDKLDTVDFYMQLDAALSCVKQRELLAIVISDQKEQARILAAIYNKQA